MSEHLNGEQTEPAHEEDSMKRLRIGFLIVAALALVTAGAAVAHGKRGKAQTDPVASTLAATQQRVTNKSCTGEDGEYRAFHGSWTGTATGDPRLTGRLKLRAHGLINTTTGDGQVTGWLRIRGEKTGAFARVVAVYNDGKLTGFVIGRARDGSNGTVEATSGSGRLLGTFSGTLGADGALAAQIDGGGQTTADANIQSGGCFSHHSDRKKDMRG
jgi:hypothetical protein